MIRSIVVGLEGTQPSDVALRYAVRIARWHGARVVMLVAAQAEPSSELESTDIEPSLAATEAFDDEDPSVPPPVGVADQHLVDAAANICGQNRVAWRAEACPGSPTRHLAHYAPRADIVTVSRRRPAGVRTRELPQHVFGIVRASQRAVLVTAETYQEPQLVLAAYDGYIPYHVNLDIDKDGHLTSIDEAWANGRLSGIPPCP